MMLKLLNSSVGIFESCLESTDFQVTAPDESSLNRLAVDRGQHKLHIYCSEDNVIE